MSYAYEITTPDKQTFKVETDAEYHALVERLQENLGDDDELIIKAVPADASRASV